jgi:hypothetical protein
MLYWRIILWLLSRKYLLHFQFHANNLLSRIFTLYKLHFYISFLFPVIAVYSLKKLEFFFGGAHNLATERFECQAQSLFFFVTGTRWRNGLTELSASLKEPTLILSLLA